MKSKPLSGSSFRRHGGERKKEEDMYKILARFMTMEAKYPEECKKHAKKAGRNWFLFPGMVNFY